MPIQKISTIKQNDVRISKLSIDSHLDHPLLWPTCIDDWIGYVPKTIATINEQIIIIMLAVILLTSFLLAAK